MTDLPKTLMLLGSGELGKEVTIAAKRLGCKVIACDRYANAPAMQIADIAEVFDMNNEKDLKERIYKHHPDILIPEIEALAVNILKDIENEGITVIPTAEATKITMNRDKIRNLATKELGLKTAKFGYAASPLELRNAAEPLGFPVIVKPLMSSSGKGQTLVNNQKELEEAWYSAIEGARGSIPKVIVEEFIKFDLEITLLTVKQKNGKTLFCDPIGHKQSKGDYQCSWQPASISKAQLQEAQKMAKLITDKLGGVGIFGVEFFISGDQIIFSELSPRPHDTGLVTIITQNLNEFELHLRAVLNLPIPTIIRNSPGASRVILSEDYLDSVKYMGINEALSEPNTEILIFGKPNSKPNRRMGVALAKDNDINNAIAKADKAASYVKVIKNDTLSTTY